MTHAPISRCGLCDTPFARREDVDALAHLNDAALFQLEPFQRDFLADRMAAHKFCIGRVLVQFAVDANTFERDELVKARARLEQTLRDANAL